MYPYANPSLLSRGLSLFKTIKWGTLLDGTQKTLGVINQAIPIFYQVKPMVSNARAMLNIASIMKEPSSTTSTTNSLPLTTEIKPTNNSPIFYI